MKKSGFSIIELLIVIAIIGVLATISTATFGGYLKSARDADRLTFIEIAKSVLTSEFLLNGRHSLTAATHEVVYDELVPILERGDSPIPRSINKVDYYYAYTEGSEFEADLLLVCKEVSFEDAIDADADPNEYVFAGGSVVLSPTTEISAGTTTIENLDDFCGGSGVLPDISTVPSSGPITWVSFPISCPKGQSFDFPASASPSYVAPCA